MRQLLRALPASDTEPVSRKELCFAAIGLYVVLATLLLAHFAGDTAEKAGEAESNVRIIRHA